MVAALAKLLRRRLRWADVSAPFNWPRTGDCAAGS
jgi:hypothetical protein